MAKDRFITSVYINREVWALAKRNARKRKLTLCDYLEMLIKKDAIAVQLEEKLLKEVGGLNPETLVLPVHVTHKIERTRRNLSSTRILVEKKHYVLIVAQVISNISLSVLNLAIMDNGIAVINAGITFRG